MIKKTLSLVV